MIQYDDKSQIIQNRFALFLSFARPVIGCVCTPWGASATHNGVKARSGEFNQWKWAHNVTWSNKAVAIVTCWFTDCINRQTVVSSSRSNLRNIHHKTHKTFVFVLCFSDKSTVLIWFDRRFASSVPEDVILAFFPGPTLFAVCVWWPDSEQLVS